MQVVGRKDTSTPAPDNLLPKAFGPGAAQQVLIQLFEDKGISQPELAALIGAHTSSKATAQEADGIPFNGKCKTTLKTKRNRLTVLKQVLRTLHQKSGM